MKLWLFFLITFISSIFPSPGICQVQKINKKSENAYYLAAKKLDIGLLDDAVDYLTKSIEYDNNNVYALQMLGDIYRKQQKFSLATPLYYEVLNLDPTLSKLTNYALGESLTNTGKYKEAIPYLLRYKESLRDESSKANVERLIANCNFSLNQKLESKITLNPLPKEINSKYDEYFPKFTATNKNIIFTRKVDNRESFYESEEINGNWIEAQKLKGFVNSSNFNEGAHCISPDGKYLYFTGCNRPDGLGSCDIYVSKNENGNWSSPTNLGAPINTRGWESQPAISADGKTLYFVSNRPGGFGGTDIWKSELDENGKWSKALNLGNNINTSFDESAPFIHPDNKTLYFSSDGWPGFGKQDLFKSQIDSVSNWSKPTNLGYPINNEFNQTAIHIAMDGEIGFLSSQDSSLQLDIYSFKVPYHLKPNRIVFINGEIVDAENKTPLAAEIIVTDVMRQEIVYKDYSDYLDGKFIATLPLGSTYALHIKKKGYLFYSKQYDMNDTLLQDKSYDNKINLQQIKRYSTIQLNNIYYAIDKAELRSQSIVELNVLYDFLQLNSDINIEIGGHTDNTGTSSHNNKLSVERANTVRDYLIEKGINKDRLHTAGYGNTQPIAENDTEHGKQLNRRTEIKILN